MPITATYVPAQTKLRVLGTLDPETITVSRTAAGALLVNGGTIPVTGGSPTVANTTLIEVLGDAGNDIVALDESAGTLTNAHLYGGAGNDTLTGGSNTDELSGEANNDTLFGRSGDDLLDGGSGNDVIDGGAGSDLMWGQGGDDLFYVDHADDVVIEAAGGGTLDRILASVSYTLGAGVQVERLATVDIAATTEIDLTGNALANVIYGNAGANALDGGVGADLMAGQGGDDSYVVDNALDAVVEGAGGGYDRIFAGVDYTLGAGVQVEILTTNGYFSDLEIDLTGNELANSLSGNTANNVLDGRAGADNLYGGAGNDWFYVDNPGDVVSENLGEGTDDRVFTSTSYALATFAHVELLAVANAASTTAINLTGSETGNSIYGNAGANVINGMAGADVMSGLGGDDMYYVDDAADVVVEGAGGGALDRIFASVSYVLGAGVQVERLATVDIAATTDIDLTGNELANVIYGNAGANELSGGAGADLMAGQGGDDAYYVDSSLDVVIEGAGGGNDRIYATADYVLAAGVQVEFMSAGGLFSYGETDLTGNELANTLQGNLSNNVLDGGAGADFLTGGGGDDWFYVDNPGDRVSEVPGEGTDDRVYTSVSYTLAPFVGIELLAVTNAASTTAINLTGSEYENSIYGNAGANVINGMAGADVMSGLGGDDWYYVDDAADAVIEGAGGGALDRIFASASYTLGAGVQVERLATVDIAATTAINLTGNALANVIYGNAGANQLNGGAGADIMAGQGGDDSYQVDSALDVIVEGTGGGNDIVYASTDYVLAAGLEVELMSAGGLFSTGETDLTGNELVNSLQGNLSHNVLDGGAGADFLAGGGDDDWFYVDNAGDVVSEVPGEGTDDRVYTTVSYSLAMFTDVELLAVANVASTTAINLTGSETDNRIYGNAGANVINGRGGADTMGGLGGDDWYYVDDAADLVYEGAGEGTLDRIFASVSYTLGGGVQVERLTTINNAATTAINLTGNTLANVIYGNAGANVLDGKAGADALIGLEGNDTFAFTTALGGGNVDAISGFVVADDRIRLENSVFTGLAGGALAAGAFTSAGTATQADDRIVYNSVTGALLFDVDGLGGAAAVQFATLSGGLALTAADFVVS